ncbi:MAG: PTS sugar transporter subunit IIA [Spirochaetes bacterium]|nr:PTS sugar transporter subunit IIA [Spirochaetota bacterium]
MDLKKYVKIENINVYLEANDKPSVLNELVNILDNNGEITNKEEILKDVWKRENLMSTGLQSGIATPHAKTEHVDTMKVVIGLKKTGIDFDALDGLPSNIFILLLSPMSSKGPHVQFLAEIARLLHNEEDRARLLASENADSIYNFFTG